VKESQIQSGEAETLFPVRNLPIEVKYDIEKTCPGLLKAFVKACTPKQKLFYLAIYNPTGYSYTEAKSEKEILRKGREGVLVVLSAPSSLSASKAPRRPSRLLAGH
jgi:hypothetical protein